MARTRRLYSKQEVADIVEREGLDEAIHQYLDAEAIEDGALSRAWAKARAIRQEIEELLPDVI